MTRTVADMIEAVEEVAAPTGAARLLAASPALARTVHGSRSYADYLTRNGHGAGFWDRSWPTLPGFPEADPATIGAGDELTTAAHVEGEAELEPDGAGRLTYRQ